MTIVPLKEDIKREYQREWLAKRRSEWIEAQGGRCVKCGSVDRLEVDHIDPSTKVASAVWSWSETRRLEELAKCQVLCHDCHKIKTFQDVAKPLVHGTSNAFNQKNCRCEDCKKWDSEDEKAYRLRVKKKKSSMED